MRNVIAFALIFCVLSFVTCQLNNSVTSGQTVNTGTAGAAGMLEIQPLQNPPENISAENKYTFTRFSRQTEKKAAGSSQSVQNSQITVSIEHVATGNIHKATVTNGLYHLKNLMDGTYRIFNVEKNSSPQKNYPNLSVYFTVRNESITVLPRIVMYDGIRIMSVNAPARKYSISYLAYPTGQPNTFIKKVFDGPEERTYTIIEP